MRLALFLPLFFLPFQADAAGLAEAVPTVISISKLIFLVLGAVSIFRIVLASSGGQPITKNLWSALVATLFPSIVLTILDYMLNLSPSQQIAGATHSGGRPFLEYVMAQTGLLTSTRVYHWLQNRGLEVAVVFGAGTAAFVISWAGDGWQKFRSWAWTAGLILVIFWPGWTMRVANSNQAVIQAQGGQVQQFQTNQKVKSQGGSVVGSITAIQVRPTRKKLSSNSEAPVVLSLINSSFDDLVGGIAGVIGGSKFLAFGMRNSVSFSKMLGASIQSDDVRSQMKFFLNNCYTPFVGGRQKSLTAWLKKPSQSANDFQIFSKKAMGFYHKSKVDVGVGGVQKLESCYQMASKPHAWQGYKYQVGLKDAVLADLAWQDPHLKKKYGWTSVLQVQRDVGRLKSQDYGTIWSTDSVVRKYHSTNAADALIEQMMRKEAYAFGYNLNSSTKTGNDPKYSRDVYGWLSKLAVFGTTAVGNISGAIQAESVNAKIPAFMSLIQLLVLSLFPLVWMFSLFPGQSKHLIDYFLLLFWSKSYVIGWAAISILDQQIGTYNPSGITDNPNDALLLVSVVQSAQWLSPLLMAAVVFGFRSAAQGGLARGAG